MSTASVDSTQDGYWTNVGNIFKWVRLTASCWTASGSVAQLTKPGVAAYERMGCSGHYRLTSVGDSDPASYLNRTIRRYRFPGRRLGREEV